MVSRLYDSPLAKLIYTIQSTLRKYNIQWQEQIIKKSNNKKSFFFHKYLNKSAFPYYTVMKFKCIRYS